MSQTITSPEFLHVENTVSRKPDTSTPAELPTESQLHQLQRCAIDRNWGLSLMLLGWLHLLAFSLCYYLTVARNYHGSTGYLAIWVSELLAAWGVFSYCGGRRPANLPPGPLELLIRRIWIAYFVLAFNLGTLNTLRGHELFEFFPAMAPLASFAFLMMAILVDWRFSGAVLVLFASGLLMAANLLHAYLIFAVAWWLVLNVTGVMMWRQRRNVLFDHLCAQGK